MSEKQVKCSHCYSTNLEVYNSTTLKCQDCGKFTRVEKSVAKSIAKKVVIVLGVSTTLGTIGFLLGGPPGAIVGSLIGSAISGSNDTIV